MTWREIHDLYEIHESHAPGGNLGARLNIAPTQDVIFASSPKGLIEINTGRWWLVPPWAKALDSKYPAFNARSETIREKPTFRSAFKSKRCLIPADGYYEWTKDEGGNKLPWFIHLNHAPFSFAGLYEYNKQLDLMSCTIITKPADGDISKLHHRVPVILKHDVWDDWVSPETQPDTAFDLLKEDLGQDLEFYRVGTNVNSSKYAGVDCADPV